MNKKNQQKEMKLDYYEVNKTLTGSYRSVLLEKE